MALDSIPNGPINDVDFGLPEDPKLMNMVEAIHSAALAEADEDILANTIDKLTTPEDFQEARRLIFLGMRESTREIQTTTHFIATAESLLELIRAIDPNDECIPDIESAITRLHCLIENGTSFSDQQSLAERIQYIRSIGHDINNLIGSIHGNIDIANEIAEYGLDLDELTRLQNTLIGETTNFRGKITPLREAETLLARKEIDFYREQLRPLLQGKTVLVVDDHSRNKEIFKDLASSLDADITIIEPYSLKRTPPEKIDIIILDHNLGDTMEGNILHNHATGPDWLAAQTNPLITNAQVIGHTGSMNIVETAGTPECEFGEDTPVIAKLDWAGLVKALKQLAEQAPEEDSSSDNILVFPTQQ